MTRVVPLILGLVAVFARNAAVGAADVCIEDWSTAAPVVKEEGLASVETVMERAKTKVSGDVVKVTLCKQGERYVYRLLVRKASGKHSPMIVDAKEPFGR